jgi:hypothetical protein
VLSGSGEEAADKALTHRPVGIVQDHVVRYNICYDHLLQSLLFLFWKSLQIWSQKSQLGKTTDANRLVTKTITLAVSVHHKINTHKLLGSDQMPQYLWKLVFAKFGESLSLFLTLSLNREQV